MAEKQHPNRATSNKGDAWVKGVHDLMDALRDTPVSEVEIRYGDTAVYLRRRPGVVPQAPVDSAPAPAAEPVSRTAIQAPFNGIYYDRSSPEADAFVQVGDRVEAGQVVALIEAMKVFNEVHADRAGRVTALLVESGDMVQSGQDLIALDAEPATSDDT